MSELERVIHAMKLTETHFIMLRQHARGKKIPKFLMGDLFARNLITRDGQLTDLGKTALSMPQEGGQ